MTIDTNILDALGDNWIVRFDDDGVSYGGFKSAPVGEWTECPKWSDQTWADCESGGLFGQGPGGGGFRHAGTRIVFAETGPERFFVGGDKVKVRRFRILYTGVEALEAALYLTGGNFPGSLYLRGLTLPDGFTIGDVGGPLDLRDCTLPAGFTIGNVGGSLCLYGCTLPDGFTIGNVGGSLCLYGGTLPDGFTIGDVGGRLDLRGCTLPDGTRVTEADIRKRFRK